ELLLDRLQRRVAIGITEAMSVGLDRDRDEVRIVERLCGRLEGRVVERPVRRPQPPDELAELTPVRLEAGAAAFGVEIILIPEAMLLIRRVRSHGAGDVRDVVTVAAPQRAHALGPQRRGDAGGTPAPVVANE